MDQDQQRDAAEALTGHYHDPQGQYDYCSDPRCPRIRPQPDWDAIAGMIATAMTEFTCAQLGISPAAFCLAAEAVLATSALPPPGPGEPVTRVTATQGGKRT